MDIKPYRKKKINAPKNTVEQPKKSISDESQTQKKQENSPRFDQKIKKRISTKSLLSKKITKNGGVFMAALGFALFILAILLYKIKSLPQLSIFDTPVFLGVNSFSKFGDSILFLPQKLVDYTLFKFGLESLAAFRIVSVFFSLAALAIFFLLINKVLSARDAVFSSFLLGTSTWFIAQSRMSTFENMLFLSVITILILFFVLDKSLSTRWLFVLFLSISLLIYIPGFIWLLLGLIIFKYKSFVNIFSKNDLVKNISLLSVFFVPLTPLVYFIVIKNNIFQSWIGLTNFENISFSNFISNISLLPKQLFLTGPDNGLIWMYNSPILDGVTLLLIGCGAIALFNKKDLSRSFKSLLTYCIIAAIVLIALSGPVYINMLIIPLYLFSAFGIGYLLNSWNSVFPLNPLAKSTALIFMSTLIGFIGYYHVFRYYQAWPKNDATKAAYSQVISGTIDTEQYNSFYLR